MQPTSPSTTSPATTSAQALGNLQSFQGGMKSGTDLLNKEQTSLGVSGAQQQVSGLRQAITNTTNLLNNVAPSVYGRTQNSLVTSAQADRQIQNESAPIQTQLSKNEQDYTGAESDLQNLLGQAGTRANLDLQGQSAQEQALEGIYGDLSSKEQAAAAQQLEQQKLAEQIREANLSASSNSGLASLLGMGAQSDGNGGPTIGYKSGNSGAGGFKFTYNNTPINAVQYSQLTGKPITSILQNMASEGDAGAKTALGLVGDDYGVNIPKLYQISGGVGSKNFSNAIATLRSLGFNLQ